MLSVQKKSIVYINWSKYVFQNARALPEQFKQGLYNLLDQADFK